MRILFVNPPPCGDTELPTKPFPIGTLILYALLKKKGHTVSLISPDNFNELHEYLQQEIYDVVGTVCFTRQRYSAFEVLKIAKKCLQNVVTVMGGPHVLSLGKKILKKCKYVDYVFPGESEISFPNFIDNLHTRKFKNISNIVYRTNNSIVKGDRKYLSENNIMELPFPNYYNGYFKEYADNSRGNMYFSSDKMAAIQLSRGCNNSCIFCANKAIFGKHKSYGAKYVFKHIRHINQSYLVWYFDFVDDNFCGNKLEAINLCKMIIKSDINIIWRTSTRFSDVTEELLELMYLAGCRMLTFGLESGSQKVLDFIGKNTTLNEVYQITSLCCRESWYIYPLVGFRIISSPPRDHYNSPPYF